MAFFPCIYFCENNQMVFMGTHFNIRNKKTHDMSNTILDRSRNRQYFYEVCLKLFSVCEERGLRLIVENPYSSVHYLVNNFPYQPSIIDKDRTRRGDYFVKPTQYWFINCKNTQGKTEQMPKERKNIRTSKSGIKAGICSEERSMISPDYARNFICDFILGKAQPDINPTLFD